MGIFNVRRSAARSLSEVDPRVGSAGRGIPNKTIPNNPADPPLTRSKLKSNNKFIRKPLGYTVIDPPGNVGSSPLMVSGISAPGGSQWAEPSPT